ncbi:MAG: hypothetical protein OEX22_09140 [Cyclobacteriaceae bacterium]|nr:hypothetical protein [Cyclobacteriaceae bacterium]
MMSETTLFLLLILNVAVIIFVGHQTYISSFEKTHRWLIYVLLLISPVFGAILFLVFRYLYHAKSNKEFSKKE